MYNHRQWVDFLFKKIELVQNKDKITGITTWAILGVIVLIGIKIYDFCLKGGILENFYITCLLWIIVGKIVSLLYLAIPKQGVNKKVDIAVLLIQPAFSSLVIYFTVLQIITLGAVLFCISSFEIILELQWLVFIIMCVIMAFYFFALLIIVLNVPITVEFFRNATERVGKKSMVFLKIFCSPVSIDLLMLVVYGYILKSSNIEATVLMRNLYLVSLLWIVIILIGVLANRRYSYCLISSLTQLQEDIVLGKLKSAKEIQEEYVDIVIGQSLSGWAAQYWYSVIEKTKRMSNILLEYEKHLNRHKELMRGEDCDSKNKEELCANVDCKKELDVSHDLVNKAKFLGKDLLKYTEKILIIANMYRDSEIKDRLLNKRDLARSEMDKLNNIVERLSTITEFKNSIRKK